MKSKDTHFAVVKLPKCLEGAHNTCDRSTNSSRMQHRSSNNSRDGHSSTHDTREGSSQKRTLLVVGAGFDAGFVHFVFIPFCEYQEFNLDL